MRPLKEKLLRYEEERLNSLKIAAWVASYDVNELYDTVVGDKEKMLNDALDALNQS